MTKIEMLKMIDHLTVCLQGPSETTVSELIESQVQWKDVQDLIDFYNDIMFECYMEHDKDFSDDYYWEFLIVD